MLESLLSQDIWYTNVVFVDFDDNRSISRLQKQLLRKPRVFVVTSYQEDTLSTQRYTPHASKLDFVVDETQYERCGYLMECALDKDTETMNCIDVRRIKWQVIENKNSDGDCIQEYSTDVARLPFSPEHPCYVSCYSKISSLVRYPS